MTNVLHPHEFVSEAFREWCARWDWRPAGRRGAAGQRALCTHFKTFSMHLVCVFSDSGSSILMTPVGGSGKGNWNNTKHGQKQTPSKSAALLRRPLRPPTFQWTSMRACASGAARGGVGVAVNGPSSSLRFDIPAKERQSVAIFLIR